MKTVVIGLLGTQKDRRGKGEQRWTKWRPTVSICQHEDLLIDRMELIFDNHSKGLAKQVKEDISKVSPESDVQFHNMNFKDPWDFEGVYSTLLDFARSYEFKPDEERYLIHITTGTHVAQICWYLLTEAGYLPGKLLQTSPPRDSKISQGEYQVIDLDLSKYDQIASRFQKEHKEGTTYLKSGIDTNNKRFNIMIEQLEQVSIRSREPILLTGPTGAGKSQLAKRVYELRKNKGLLDGDIITINCATLKGENAMSALFGHRKGAFTGATHDRPGLLKEAHQGLLFLDEIGELGLDEQAMLLRAIEDKRFLPFGADKETTSDFQLIAGTNRNLVEWAEQGKFRADLLARIDLWSYRLPSLKERIEDLEPNVDFELEAFGNKSNQRISFNKAAREKYLSFGRAPTSTWKANFRDLNASITRMATFSTGGRINEDLVADEIVRLEQRWHTKQSSKTAINLEELLPEETIQSMDYLDQVSLSAVIEICRQSNSMAEAGRKLFAASRQLKKSTNDSHRVKQILDKYELSFDQLKI